MKRFRGTCVAIDNRAVLIRGSSGSGKSDLALRLIGEGAVLVSDDYTDLARDGGRIIATAPKEIRGMLEVRGLGVLMMDVSASAVIVAIADLVPIDRVPRLPEPETADILGLPVARFRLAAFEASATAKVRLAMRLATGSVLAAR